MQCIILDLQKGFFSPEIKQGEWFGSMCCLHHSPSASSVGQHQQGRVHQVPKSYLLPLTNFCILVGLNQSWFHVFALFCYITHITKV